MDWVWLSPSIETHRSVSVPSGALAVEWDAVDDPEVEKPIDLHQEQSGADARLLLAAAIPPSDRLGDDRDRLVVVVKSHRGDLRLDRLRLIQGFQASAVRGVVVDHRADPLVQVLARRWLARCELEIELPPAPAERSRDHQHDVGLALEVEVERRAARVGLRHDVLDRGRGITLALKRRDCALDQEPTSHALLLVAQRPAFAGVIARRHRRRL